MVEAVSNVLLETLRELLVTEVKFLSGVSDGVKKVEEDLKFMYELMMKADANRGATDSPIFKNCISQLKDLAFRAENVLETYAVDVLSKREGKSLKKKLQRLVCMLCECSRVHEVGIEVEDIRSDLAILTDSLSSISKGEARPSDQEQRPLLRIRHAHEVEQHFVGMKKDIDCVVSKVKDDSPHAPSIISICGMGGLGKTSLARKIYNHRDIQGHFRAFAWVCVTQQFQAETILKQIFEEIDGKKHEMGYPELVKGLHNVLEQKKCFIVIDDIWEDEHWCILKPAFPKSCKIVLTTRDANVASNECHLHKLDFLSEDEGWELLRKIAQVSETKSISFESIGRKMVRECGCLPLAISVIGGILRQKQQILTEWEEVSSNMDAYLRNGGEGMGNNERVNLVLDLSFDVLPYYLKPCFLYLACFSEDEDINAEKLYLLWMAEGLISSEGKGNNETLRDVAERYLTELALRCMVQVKKCYFNTPHKKFESCRLHDLMRELCSSKAEQERFIKRVDFSTQQQGILSAISSSLHRLAICVNDENVSTTLNTLFMDELKHLRSLLVLTKFYLTRIESENRVKFENFKRLRILVFNGVKFEDRILPSRIVKLIHLKYLELE